jgi:hypothetical protein
MWSCVNLVQTLNKTQMKKLVDWLIKRRLKQLHIPIVMGSVSAEEKYKRTLNTLRENKLMVKMDTTGA